VSTSSAGCSPATFGIVSPFSKRGEHLWAGRRKHGQWHSPPMFVSYLRIGRIDFDATSSDLVVLSLLCRMVQSARIFMKRKSRKVDNQGKRDLTAESVEIRVTSGGLSKS
jgi:hypothetical protein